VLNQLFQIKFLFENKNLIKLIKDLSNSFYKYIYIYCITNIYGVIKEFIDLKLKVIKKK
jgi:hypothetical protein